MRRIWSDKRHARHGEEHSQWKGGTSMSADGYTKLNINLVDPIFHSMACSSGWILEHRYVMAAHLGRALTSSELVHHRNEDRTDNTIDNLVLVSRSSHMREHESHKIMAQGKRSVHPILNVNTGVEYLSQKSAAIAAGVSRDSVGRSIKEARPARGITFIKCPQTVRVSISDISGEAANLMWDALHNVAPNVFPKEET